MSSSKKHKQVSLLSEAEGEKSTDKTVMVVSLGCAKNQVDSEVMLGVLCEAGYEPVSAPEEAKTIIVNTCGFLKSAVEEAIDLILELSEFKKTGRCLRLIVAGCMVERYREKLVELLPEVDRFLATDEILSIAEEEVRESVCFRSERKPAFIYNHTDPRFLESGVKYAYLKVAEGCDRHCSFCIIPRLRGDLRSRTVESVVLEAQKFLRGGIRELNLIAQDTTAYGRDFDKSARLESPLIRLLRTMDELGEGSDEFWIRLLYAYPTGVTEELLELINSSTHICRYLDLPLQHISAPVLRQMDRPSENYTRRLIEKIRKAVPSLALRTTFLVGFPGETEDDVRILEQFVAEGHFIHLGVFAYSAEEESRSSSLPDTVSDEEKAERVGRIMELQQGLVQQRASDLLGKRVEVLIEGPHPETELLIKARASWQAPEIDGEIIINEFDESLMGAEGLNGESLAGRFAEVELTEHRTYDFIGKLVSVKGGLPDSEV